MLQVRSSTLRGPPLEQPASLGYSAPKDHQCSRVGHEGNLRGSPDMFIFPSPCKMSGILRFYVTSIEDTAAMQSFSHPPRDSRHHGSGSWRFNTNIPLNPIPLSSGYYQNTAGDGHGARTARTGRTAKTDRIPARPPLFFLFANHSVSYSRIKQ